MKLFHGSIRKKLVILVLLATTPVFIILLATGLINRQYALQETEKDTALFLKGFAEVQRRITGSTRTLLRTVASIPDISDAKVEQSRVILSTLLEANPIYTNVILVNIEGDVVAAGRNHENAKRFNFGDRKQFKEAIVSRGFATGEFVVGKSSQKAIFPLGMAVLDQQGAPQGAIIIGIDLSHYGGLYEGGAYPRGAFFGICDHKGIRLFRYPVSEKVVFGKPIKSKVFQAVSKTQKPGSVIALATDGKKRVIVFEPLRSGEGETPYMYMFMGFDYEQIQDQSRAILIRLAVILLMSLVIALAIAWFLGGNRIARRIEKLTMMAKEFGRTEKDVVSELDYSDGEVGELARSFDNMVLMLRQREDERNVALEQLSISELRFRELIEDVSSISVQGYDEKRKVIFWNKASEEFYGYSTKEAVGQKLEDLIIPQTMKEGVKKAHSGWLETGVKIPSGELVLVDKWGKDVPVYSSHIMLETKYGKEMFCIDIDMRPIKKSEAEKEQLLRRLQQSQKMEAIGTLAGGIAHDFNNILVPILGYSQILLRESKENNSTTSDSLTQICSSALRAKELVQQILAFSRQESTNFKPTKIQPIFKEVIKLLRSTLPKNIDIKEDIDPNCRRVNADVTHIHQILMNLATNAYHGIGEREGELKMTLNECDTTSLDFENLDLKPGKAVCLTVADNGSGIPSDVINRIYDPFFTTKEKGKGTGMGLSVVHGIVKNMKGCIDVKSEVGQGTEFRIYFPIEENLIGDNLTKDKQSSSLLTGTERIMLVDDDEAVLQMEKKALELLGYRVVVKNCPFDALEAFKNGVNDFDLVITDMSMPRMSGDRLASEILRIRLDIPIILCTGLRGSMTAELARNIGIKEVLIKPVLLRELSVKIRQVLEGDTETSD